MSEFRDRLEKSLSESLEKGLIEVVSHDVNGEPQYAVTKQGEAHVERLLDDALAQAVTIFAHNIGIAPWMARDLLLHRAVQLKELNS